MTEPDRSGMTLRQARTIEFSIIALCILALVFLFQPFSLTLYGIGAGLVVLGGLSFNLIPLCRPGVPAKSVVKVAGIVLTILVVVIAIAIASAYLYAIYLKSQ